MDLNEVSFNGRTPVDGYGPGMFRVGGAVHSGPLALLPEGPLDWGGLPDIAAIAARAGQIDVLLIGTGAGIAPLPPEARQTLEALGIGVEVMDTPAACRSFNVLLAEARRVGLAAMPV